MKGIILKTLTFQGWNKQWHTIEQGTEVEILHVSDGEVYTLSDGQTRRGNDEFILVKGNVSCDITRDEFKLVH